MSAFELSCILKDNVAAKSLLATDDFSGYQIKKAVLDEHLKHMLVTQDKGGKSADSSLIIHTLLSTIKARLVGIKASPPNTSRAICANGPTASTAAISLMESIVF